jgi:histidinol-phosphatase (PHP family)
MPDVQLLEVTGDRQNFELIRNQNNLEDKELMLLYFQANADMLEDANVDVLGHLDKMKINIPNFNEILASDKDVQKVLDSVLHLCDREDVVIEVNTRGQYKSNSKESYPGPFILNRILEEELNICISSDAHGINESRMLFDETKEMLKATGHKYIFTFDGYDWVPEKL